MGHRSNLSRLQKIAAPSLLLLAAIILSAFSTAAKASSAWDYEVSNPSPGVYRVVDGKGRAIIMAGTAQEAGDKLFDQAKTGVVRFAEGHFRGQWTIQNTDGLTLEGIRDKTVIECPNSWATCFIIGKTGATSTENRNVTVKDLVFDGRLDAGSGGCGLILSACDTFHLDYLTFMNQAPSDIHGDSEKLEYARTLGLTVWTPTQAPSVHGTVTDCRFLGTTLTCGGLKDVHFDHLYFNGERRNSNSVMDISFGEVGPAALVENVSFDHVTIDGITGGYVNEQGKRLPLDCLIAGFQYVRNVSFNHVKINNQSQSADAFHFFAWPKDSPFIQQNVTLNNSDIKNVRLLWDIPHATISNTSFRDFDYAIDANDAKITNCTFDRTRPSQASVLSIADIVIFNHANSNVAIDRCTFRDSQATPTTPEAIQIYQSSGFSITGCHFIGPFTSGKPITLDGDNTHYRIVGNKNAKNESSRDGGRRQRHPYPRPK